MSFSEWRLNLFLLMTFERPRMTKNDQDWPRNTKIDQERPRTAKKHSADKNRNQLSFVIILSSNYISFKIIQVKAGMISVNF